VFEYSLRVLSSLRGVGNLEKKEKGESKRALGCLGTPLGALSPSSGGLGKGDKLF
jgi:hypothetical protein